MDAGSRMKRRNFTRAVSVEIFKRASVGRGIPSCERCGAVGLKMDVHHRVMDAMEIDKARRLTAEDGELLCGPCHDPITSKQRKVLAKALAREAKHVGADKPNGTLKGRQFEKVERKHEGREPANGMSEIARRFSQ